MWLVNLHNVNVNDKTWVEHKLTVEELSAEDVAALS